MNNSGFERRERPRLVCQNEVQIVAESGEATVWTIRDISAQGMQVEGQDLAFFPLGSVVQYLLNFAAALEGIVIHGEGKVVWKSETGKMGIRFWETTPNSLDQLRQLLEFVGQGQKKSRWA